MDRIGLVGGVGTGNTGNEVSLDVVRDFLARAIEDSRFAIVTPTPVEARTLVARGDDVILPMRAPRRTDARRSPCSALARLGAEVRHVATVARSIGRLRALVVCGTGMLDDFTEPPWGMPWSLVLWAALAKVRRRPFILIGVGAGPIDGNISRLLFAATVRMADSVSYRDEASRSTMADAGADRADARVICDLAFARDIAPGPAAAPGPVMTVGVAVMDWGGWSGTDDTAASRYRNLVVDVVVGLLDRGHRVTLHVGQPVDLPVADDVRHRVVGLRPSVGDRLAPARSGDFDDLCHAVQRTDLIIASRYHTVVAGLLCQRPLVSLGYAPKNQQVLAGVGLAGADRAIDEATAAWVLSRVDAIADGADPTPAGASSVVAHWRVLARGELAALANRLAPGPCVPLPSAEGDAPTSQRP